MIQPFILSFLTLALLHRFTKSLWVYNYNFCETSGNYTANSTYETNLNNLFSSLTQNTSKTGFYTGTEGELPNQVFGLALCRGDISEDFCTGCVTMASQHFPQLCPYNKGGLAWYDRCFVRYSNHNFFSQLDDDIQQGLNDCLVQNASDPYQHKQQVFTMIESLSYIAAFNRSAHMFATGAGTGLYAMVQCTRDLSEDQCFNCLNQTLYSISDDQCDINVQANAFRGSCVVRIDKEQFFNSDPTWVAPPDPDPTIIPPVKASAPTRTQKGNHNIFKILST